MKRIIFGGLVAALALLAGCTRIDTGSVAIVRNWSGSIDSQPAGQGRYVSFLTKYIPIDTTQTRAEVDHMQPADAHGVQVSDLTVVVTYNLKASRVAKFYRVTKELDREPHSDYYTLGYEILTQSAIPSAVQAATAESNMQDLAADRPAYAQAIEKQLNLFLNQHYGTKNPFVIDSITLPVFRPPQAIQDQMNAKASAQARLEALQAQLKTIKASQVNAEAQASVDANALADAAKTSGLTPDQIIAWKRAQALEDLASRNGRAPTVLMTAGK